MPSARSTTDYIPDETSHSSSAPLLAAHAADTPDTPDTAHAPHTPHEAPRPRLLSREPSPSPKATRPSAPSWAYEHRRYVLIVAALLFSSLFFLQPLDLFRGHSGVGTDTGTGTGAGSKDINMTKRSVGYFVNWGIYGRKFPPQQIPHEHLTHINYAFANVNKESGEVVLSDSWADLEIHYEGDSWNDEGTNLYGCFKAIYLLKKQNRNLKVLLSIGGWTYSPNFEHIANPAWREKFVQSAVKLVEDVGLDGLDIDYEYPKTPSDADAYVCLLQELRSALDALGDNKGHPGQYQLTVAAPCGWDNMQMLRVAEMDQALDFWNLMAYDFAGSWDSVAGHQANLYSSDTAANSIDKAVQFYLAHGVDPSKLVIGMPLYGRAFADTDGIGAPYNGVGEGSWEGGMWDYKVLPLQGSHEVNDHQIGASYSYDPARRLLVSYDTQAIALQKVDYIHRLGLGGAMWWELDADASEESGRNLVRTVREALGALEQRENELDYPESKYDNLRNRCEQARV